MEDTMGIFYIDGEFVSEEKAVLPVSDMAVLRGFAVFDFLRTYGRRPFHLNDHLQRLRRSAELIGLSFPWPESEISKIVVETVGRNVYEEANIRLVVTGGDSPDSITPCGKSRLLVLVTEVAPLPAEWYANGVKVVTARVNRYIPEAKSTNYVNAVIALQKARKKEAIESLYVDDNGFVREGTTTNFFMVAGRQLVTPESGILSGITRKVILKICSEFYPVTKRPISLEELKNADEVFISASNKQVVPVVQVDESLIGDGKPGQVTRDVMQKFQLYTKEWGSGADRSHLRS